MKDFNSWNHIKQETEGKYYFKISDINERKNTLILSQLRLFDAKRLEYKIGVVDKVQFQEIKRSLTSIFNETS